MGLRMDRLLKMMRKEFLRRLEEERKKRKEVIWLRRRLPLKSHSGGAFLERRSGML